MRGFLLPVALVLLGAGCGRRAMHDAAEKRLAAVYADISSSSHEQALTNYADSFFTATPRDQWMESLAHLREQVGAYESHTIRSLQHETRKGDEAGHYIHLQAEVSFENAITDETILLVKREGESTYRIRQHLIESDSFLSEVYESPATDPRIAPAAVDDRLVE